MPSEEKSDDDYRSLAAGYLTRARRTLELLERKRRRLPLDAGLMAVLPPLAMALPNMEQSKRLPFQLAGLLIGIAAAILTKRSELLDPNASGKKEALRGVIAELETVPATGSLSAWNRQVIDEADAVIKRFMEQ